MRIISYRISELIFSDEIFFGVSLITELEKIYYLKIFTSILKDLNLQHLHPKYIYAYIDYQQEKPESDLIHLIRN